jgi:hypothetical protein
MTQTREEQHSSQPAMLHGLNLVDSTPIVSDLVTDLQQKSILLVAGPYEGAYLNLYRIDQEIHYWRTVEKLSFTQLSAMSHETLAYPEGHQGQCEAIRTLVLDTFFILRPEENSNQSDQKPDTAISLSTVREINKALRAHFERTGGKVCCLSHERAGIMQVFHARQPRGDSLKVAGGNGYWITPLEVWVEQSR